MGIRCTGLLLAFAPAMFAAAHPAPTPPPTPPSIPARPTQPTTRPTTQPFDHRSPVAWFDRAMASWQAVTGDSTRTPGSAPSPLMLIALGQATTGDKRLADTIALLRAEADTNDTPAGRAFAYVRLAMFPHPTTTPLENRLELLKSAWLAAGQVESASLNPLVDLEVLTALARTGEFESAEAIARATTEIKPRAAQFCALAMAAGERGDATACGEYIRSARRLTIGQDDDTTSTILLKIGQVQAAFGDNNAVRLTIDAIPGPRWQIELLIDLARRQRLAHNSPGYLDSVRATREAAANIPVESRIAALAPLAAMQADTGDPTGARETIALALPLVDELTDLRARIAAQLDLAAACARAADSTGCMDLILSADTAKLKLPPSKTVDGLPELGDNDPFRQQAVRAIAALARSGQIDTATTLAKPYQFPGERDILDWALSEARASRGHLPDALTHFDRLQTPAFRAWAARRIAEAYASRGQFASLDTFIARLTPAEQAWANLGAAEGLIGHRIIDRKNSAFCQLGVE